MSFGIMNLLRIVCDFLFKVRDLTFPLILNNKRPRRSIVRYIGSVLPLPSAPKVYFHLPAWQPSTDSPTTNDLCSITTDEDEGNETSSDWSEAVCVHDATIQQLQEELKALREQVASILAKNNESQEAKETSEHVRPPPPPPPLPPPPPPLPTLLVSVDTQVTPLRPRKPLAPRNDIGHPLSAVLSEMKNGRPKLKPIERSPGGRPIKLPKKATDPSDILTEVLKKRFLAINISSDNIESDESSPEWNTSFS